MQNIQDKLIAHFDEATRKAFPEYDGSIPLELLQSNQEKFGHYQFNSAMKLSKLLKHPPRQIAEAIIKQMPQDPMIAKLEVAGPGFINVTISAPYLSCGVDAMLRDKHLGIEMPKHKQRIVIDFSSPNTAKEMHVGHLRSTIIGDCLSRLFEFLGQDVLRLNHIGDFGTSFGMLIAYMKKQAPQVLSGEETTDLTHLMAWYRAAKKHFDAEPNFKKNSQLEVVALQAGEPEAVKAWEIICDISREAYNKIYDLLDVKLTERGESFYKPLLASIVTDFENKGLVTISEGAKCVFVEGFQNREGETLPLMIQKSDGAYNYDTTDLAAIRHRIEEEKADRILYVVDAGQGTHLQMIFKAAEKAGYLDPQKVSVEHVPFGLVLGGDGKKFRSRAGDTERLIDLLYTAIDYAKKILHDRSPDMDPEEIETLAHALGIGSVKYADLANHRTGDYTFSYERMLKFEGNTAPYLLYAYVRVAGIKRKVGIKIEEILDKTKIQLEHPSEVALGLHLMQFDESLEQMARDLLPHRLTEYLYGLAEKFNAFFRDCRVEGSPQQNQRLLLCEITARVLKQGLEILGLRTVERM